MKLTVNFLILVHTSSHAISIERKLKDAGISCKLSSIPRNISSDCGICVRFNSANLEQVEKIVRELPFEIVEIIPAP